MSNMTSLNKVQSHLLAECFNKLFIGGQFVDAIDGEKIPTYYPATGEFLHEFPRGKANDVEAAIAAAEAAWAEGTWAGMAAAANYAWVNRSSMTFLTRQAFAKVQSFRHWSKLIPSWSF